MTPETLVLLGLLGAGIGILGTLVGVGGGFILTPVLLLIYPHEGAAKITAISLAVVFFNAGSGSVAYARQRRVDFRSGMIFAAATLPGAILGALVVGVAPRRIFDLLMAVLLAAMALWLLAGRTSGDRHRLGKAGSHRVITDAAGHRYEYNVPVRRGALFSLGVGFVSSFLGIGGGIIHVPLMVQVLGFPVHLATATSHFVLANMSLVGSLTHLVAGDFGGTGGLVLPLAAGVVAGAQGGAWLSQRLHGHLIQRLLALALLVLAVRLFWAAL